MTDVFAAPASTSRIARPPQASRRARHPLADAIVDGAQERGVPVCGATEFEAVTGKGVAGRVGGRSVALGNRAMMESVGVGIDAVSETADALRSAGKTAMFVSVDGKLAGIVAVADPIKPTTADAIRALHETGLKIVMATGDNERTANAVAARLGIDEVRADMLPESKKALVDELRASGARVAMAGDGVNDAPALAAADVGIAMGTGADVAMESAGITLVKGDLNGIVRARKLARATMRNIKQNSSSLLYNALGVPIPRRPLPADRNPPLADDRGGGDEPVFGVGDHQFAPAAVPAAELNSEKGERA